MIMHTGRRYFCSACAGLLLGACADVKLPGSLSNLNIGGGSPKGAPTLDTVGSIPPPPARDWPDIRLDLMNARADGWGLVPMPEMEAYLNGLLATIKKTAGTPNYPGSVHIISENGLNANSSPGGNIFVSVGWLQSAESEDEIFAILSHEFGHIYLNHHAIFDARTAGDTSLAVVSLAWTVTNKSPTSNTWTGVDNIAVVQTLGTRVLFPAWQRSVEEQADRFGATISLRCGYSYVDGFKAFFERVIAYDQDAKTRRQKLREKQLQAGREKAGQQAAAQARAQPVAPAVGGGAAQTVNQLTSIGELRDAVAQYTSVRAGAQASVAENLFDARAVIDDQISAQLETLHDDHGDPAAREDNLTELVRPMLGDKRPDPRIEPWNAARKRGSTALILAHYRAISDLQDLQAAGNYPQALQVASTVASGPTADHAYPVFLLSNLMTLSRLAPPDTQTQVLRRNLSSRDRSWAVQTNLSNRIGQKDPKQGEAFLLQQFEYFGRTSVTWPGVISWYREHGDVNRAKQLALSCTAEHPEMRAACVAASQTPAQKKSDDQAGGFSKAVDKMFDQAKGLLPK
ncbi:Peptidase family M48 [Burkholderia sp. Ch1-1]|uniref:Peptidase family M48 n=2 Tax=Burkholderiaceae TaxID=119060 RepID=A0A5Q4ZKG6_9BURK|nr:Peptidase family M48 [Burkholderia sp. Ch1-1]VVD34105.1 Peptidase family M48 [Paraburkholderia dioscoreae]